MGRVISWSLAAAALLVLTLILNAGVFSAAWRWDDPSILLHAQQFSIVQDLTEPDVWQQFSPANLTPLLILSMEIDLILAGMSPWFFYLHQLLVLALAALLIVVLLRHWCAPRFAISGGILFLCGLPVLLVAEQLMTRHYAEGLVLSLLALIGFVRYLRTSSLSMLLLSLLAYVLAVTAKEVYVPLPLLLPFLPESGWRRRLLASLPFFAVTVGYAVWRSRMLPDVLGGYGTEAGYLSRAYLLQTLESFSAFPRLLIGGWWPVFVGLYLLLFVRYLWLKRVHRSAGGGMLPLFSLLAAALVLLPLVPLVQTPGIVLADRYLFALWAAFSFSVAFYAGRFAAERRSLLSLSAIALMAVLSLLHALPERQHVAAVGRAFDVQGEFLWQQNDSVSYQPSVEVLPSLWFATGLAEFKARIGAGSSPTIVVDDIFLVQTAGNPVYTYDGNCECMLDVSADAAQRQQRFEMTLRQQAPLSVDFSYRNSVVSWQFGPYNNGRYQLVSNQIGVIEVPSAGSMRAILADGAGFYIRYQSPEGWQTYSELFQVVRDGPAIVWVRE